MSINRRGFLRAAGATAAVASAPAAAVAAASGGATSQGDAAEAGVLLPCTLSVDAPAIARPAREHLRSATEQCDQPIMLAASFALLPRRGWSDETLKEFKSALQGCSAKIVYIRGAAGELVHVTVRYANKPKSGGLSADDVLAHQIHAGDRGKSLVTDLKYRCDDGDNLRALDVEWLLVPERVSWPDEKSVSRSIASERILVKSAILNAAIENNTMLLPGRLAANMAVAVDDGFLGLTGGAATPRVLTHWS